MIGMLNTIKYFATVAMLHFWGIVFCIISAETIFGGYVMQFFRFEGIIADKKLVEETDNRRSMREKAREISAKTNDFNRNRRNSYIFVSDMGEGSLIIGIIAKLPCDVQKLVDEYIEKLRIELKDTVLEEITFHSLSDLLDRASDDDFIKNSDDVLERFELDNLDNYSLQYGENVIELSNKKSISAEKPRSAFKNCVPCAV